MSRWASTARLTHGLFAYESTLRVPLIVAEVGNAAGARSPQDLREVSDQPARHVDIAPTILDALALPVPPELPGHTLRTRADREAAPRAPHISKRWNRCSTSVSRRSTACWRDAKNTSACRFPSSTTLPPTASEKNNLADSSGERVRVLAARLNDYHASAPGEKQPESPEVAARLRALGYVSGSAALKSTYGERDDPKRLVDIDRLMHEAVALDDEGKLG